MATTRRFGGLCGCGCGQKTQLAPRNHDAWNVKKGEPYEYIQNHHGEKKRSNYVVDVDGCHVWQGQRSQRYPSLKIKGKPKKVHQHFWEQAHGPIPKGMVLHHKCENTRCCNVEHLEVVTPATNAHAGPNIRLSMESADKIRQLASTEQYSYKKLAEMFSVSKASVENVVYGHTWRPIELHRPQRPSRRIDP